MEKKVTFSKIHFLRPLCENLLVVQWTTHCQEENPCKEKDSQPGFQ